VRLGAVIAVLAGCGRIGFRELDDAGGAMGDAVIDAPPGDSTISACTTWGPPSAVMAGINSADYDWEPTLSPGGKTLVFTRSPTVTTFQLFMATRAQPTDAFGAASMVLAGPGNELGAVWTRDGSGLYFVSDRQVAGNPRLWYADFNAGTFGTPQQVSELATEPITGPGLSPDGLELIYSDPGPGPTRPRRATRATVSSPWIVAGVIPELDSLQDEGYVTFTPDGLTIYFESTRDSANGFIYTATRPALGAPFGAVIRADVFNAGTTESGDPELSPDGSTIVYAAAMAGNAGNQDIYTRTCQ
jgi:Tol biopolymer transport system component